MSNCYVTFYFELPLPSQAVCDEVSALLGEAEDYHDKSDLERQRAAEILSDVFEDFCEYEELGFEWEPFQTQVNGKPTWTLRVYADENGNVDHAGNLVTWLLPKLDIKAAGFEWAAYGGGDNGGGAAAYIKTDEGVKEEYVSTYMWLQEKLG
jgi:hypothetical protein